jgi:diaminopimelate decarboxylase
MDQAAFLLDQYFATRDHELWIGGVAISDLANRYGTPFYVYDLGVIDRKWQILCDALPAEFSIFYSVKANPNQEILRHFVAKGAGLEIASAGEFSRALAADCPPESIVFAGPGKTPAELKEVVRKGIGELHVESLREAQLVAEIACEAETQARVAVRVNPRGEAEGGAMRMGGRPAPFGVDEESLDEVVDLVLRHKSLDFRGIHLFSGTQILDSEILVDQYRVGLAIARRVAARLNHPLHTVDFGGGLGIPYFPHEAPLDMRSLRQRLEQAFCPVSRDPLFTGTRFYVEPGRFLVGEAGIYVTRVNDIKTSRGKRFVIVDGGMNHHLAASGNLGQTIKRNYPLAVLNKIGCLVEDTVDVVGPLCTPLDVLGRSVSLPKLEVGDLVGVFQSGAYGRSASPLGFLSHPAPPEISVYSGQDQLICSRGEA